MVTHNGEFIIASSGCNMEQTNLQIMVEPVSHLKEMNPQSEKQKNEKRTAESERRLSDFALAFRFSFLAFVFFVCHTAAQAATYTAASCNQSDVNAVINGP